MICKVKYWKGELLNGYAGREYTYLSDLPLRVGDKVVAPTAKEPMQKAIVVATNLPDTVIDPAWKHALRYITQMDEEE